MLEAMPLRLTPEKATLILDSLIKHETMFSDYQPACPEVCGQCVLCWQRKAAVAHNIASPKAMVWEVWNDAELCGILWLADVVPGHDARCELAFWDGKLSGKAKLINSLFQGPVFGEPLNLHRVTVEIPRYMHALGRWLERRVGFQQEGIRREAMLKDGTWHDKLLYGKLRD